MVSPARRQSLAGGPEAPIARSGPDPEEEAAATKSEALNAWLLATSAMCGQRPMEIDMQQDPFRSKEVTFSRDLSSDDEDEEVQWEPGDTLVALQAEEAAMKGALKSLLQVVDIPEDEMSQHLFSAPSRRNCRSSRRS